jgi:hypothetical protein
MSPKYYKVSHWKYCTLELRVSQLDRTSIFSASKSPIWPAGVHITLSRGSQNFRIFRPWKCRRVNQRKQDTPDPRLSWPLKNNIFRWPKCLRGRHECRWVTQRNQDTLDPRLSWTLKINIFRWPKWRKLPVDFRYMVFVKAFLVIKLP